MIANFTKSIVRALYQVAVQCCQWAASRSAVCTAQSAQTTNTRRMFSCNACSSCLPAFALQKCSHHADVSAQAYCADGSLISRQALQVASSSSDLQTSMWGTMMLGVDMYSGCRHCKHGCQASLGEKEAAGLLADLSPHILPKRRMLKCSQVLAGTLSCLAS